MSSTAPTALSHRTSLDESGISPRNSHFDNNGPIDPRHVQHAAGWYGDRPDGKQPQQPGPPPQLPSLSDMLDKDAQQGLPGRLPHPAGSPPMAGRSPIYQNGEAAKRVGGSKLPDARPAGDSALPIHALLSNQQAPNSLYAKAPRRGPSLDGKAGVELHSTPGYGMCEVDCVAIYCCMTNRCAGFLSNSPTFRHMKTEQAGDGDVVMTTELPAASPSGSDKGRFDGMSALLQAGEIVGRRGGRR